MASSKLNKKLYTDITRLRLLDKDSAEVRFRLQQSPFTADDDEDEMTAKNQEEFVITGQIFPNSEIFRERSYLIEMKLTKSFPMTPPEVRFLTPMYHPNVGKDGKYWNEILQKTAKWTPLTSLTDVIKALVYDIDHPNIDNSISAELGREYQENRAEFNRKALEYVLKHGLPR